MSNLVGQNVPLTDHSLYKLRLKGADKDRIKIIKNKLVRFKGKRLHSRIYNPTSKRRSTCTYICSKQDAAKYSLKCYNRSLQQNLCIQQVRLQVRPLHVNVVNDTIHQRWLFRIKYLYYDKYFLRTIIYRILLHNTPLCQPIYGRINTGSTAICIFSI